MTGLSHGYLKLAAYCLDKDPTPMWARVAACIKKGKGVPRWAKIGAVIGLTALLLYSAYSVLDYLFGSRSPNADPDNDGLTNQQERGLGTNPLKPTLVWYSDKLGKSTAELLPELQKVKSDYQATLNINLNNIDKINLKDTISKYESHSQTALTKIQPYREAYVDLINNLDVLIDVLSSPNSTQDEISQAYKTWNAAYYTDLIDYGGEGTLPFIIKSRMENKIKSFNYGVENSNQSISDLQSARGLAYEGLGNANIIEQTLKDGNVSYDTMLSGYDMFLYHRFNPHIDKTGWPLFDVPGYLTVSESRKILNEPLRQVERQLSPSQGVNDTLGMFPCGFEGEYNIPCEDRTDLNIILNCLPETERAQIVEVVEKSLPDFIGNHNLNNTRYGMTDISYLTNNVGNHHQTLADIVRRGLNNGEIKNVEDLANILNPVRAVRHEGGMDDYLYEKNFSLLPRNYENYSKLDLAGYIDGLVFDMFIATNYCPDVRSCQQAWNIGGADVLGGSILNKSVLGIAGYNTYSRVKYLRLYPFTPYSTILKENNKYYYLAGNHEATEHKPIDFSISVWNLEIIYKPYLGGYVPMEIYK